MHLAWYAVLVWSAWIAFADLTQRRVPNPLSLGAVALAAGVLVIQGTSVLDGTLDSALLAAGVALVLTLPAYLGNVLGAGDVKLALAMGLLSDLPTLTVTFIVGSMLAGLWAGLWLATQRSSLLATWMNTQHWNVLKVPGNARRPVPFGAALCLGFAASVVLQAI